MFFVQINHTGKGFLFLIFREIKLRKYSSLHKIFYGLKTILINQLRGYGISLIDDELTTTVNINHFAEAKNRNSIIKELQR